MWASAPPQASRQKASRSIGVDVTVDESVRSGTVHPLSTSPGRGLMGGLELFRYGSGQGSGQVSPSISDLNPHDRPLLVKLKSDVLVQFLAVADGTTADDKIENVHFRVIVGSQLDLPCQDYPPSRINLSSHLALKILHRVDCDDAGPLLCDDEDHHEPHPSRL